MKSLLRLISRTKNYFIIIIDILIVYHVLLLSLIANVFLESCICCHLFSFCLFFLLVHILIRLLYERHFFNYSLWYPGPIDVYLLLFVTIINLRIVRPRLEFTIQLKDTLSVV